jgi:hypothetical protein
VVHTIIYPKRQIFFVNYSAAKDDGASASTNCSALAESYVKWAMNILYLVVSLTLDLLC